MAWTEYPTKTVFHDMKQVIDKGISEGRPF